MTCQSCGADAAPDQRFCGQCGSRLGNACPSCGRENAPENRFCGSCGTALSAVETPATAVVAERRLVSVLFADLVGFTTLSEHRDPDEVRELLSRYFDRCRTLIERYGGTVEKFIGDAVMAVWGSPIAREDDAERAVRAALALAPAVTALGEEAGLPDLRVRAGVLTGRAAVERGAEAEGMVLGDTVNSAARLQGIAPPGAVFVDDVTRRATEAAIVYEDAGSHQVKGRDQPIRAWHALRVVALVGGASRSRDLEAPLVGRAGDLSLIIERFEETAREGRARLVCVTGPAGSGKSRLNWEFTKYLDGITGEVMWHRGRCLSYGEGVAYAALAEMVRMRARIAEDEDPASAREKLTAVVAEHVPDEREQRLVEPRLAHLLGLEQRAAPDRADLFSGWRLFFERLARTNPVALVFEDLQWADAGLLEFVDHLLDWSADLPIFVLALARPELLERRRRWAEAHGDIDLVELAPLSAEAMDELLEGLVPGLSPDLRDRVSRRAEGIPLYAVETVRMLLDRGVLVRDGDRYAVHGEIDDLEVPETLSALVGARLDGLAPLERSLVQEASVLGQTFTAEALSAVSAHPAAQVQAGLQALVAKQVLRVEDDPRASDKGQFVFLQDIVRSVAYETLSRRDRKALHLAAARHLRATAAGDPTLAELLAVHELSAVRADPDAADAPVLRASAQATLAEAGERALSLASGDDAGRYFEQAADLAEEPAERATLLARAGEAVAHDSGGDRALTLLRTASGLFAAAGRGREAAAVQIRVAELHLHDQPASTIALLDEVLPELGDDPDEVLAEALTLRARVATVDPSANPYALELVERALSVAEIVPAPRALAHSLVTRGIALASFGRLEESVALYKHAIDYASRHDLASVVVRAAINLTEVQASRGSIAEASAEIDRALALARERGDRYVEAMAEEQRLMVWDLSGGWDEIVSAARAAGGARSLSLGVPVLAERGELELAAAVAPAFDEAELLELGFEDQAILRTALAAVARATGDPATALREAATAFETTAAAMACTPAMAFRQLRLAAAEAGDDRPLAAAVERLDSLPRGTLAPVQVAEWSLGRAQLAAPGDAELAYAHAVDVHRPLGFPFGLAEALLGQATALQARGAQDTAAPLLAEAREIFAALGAPAWIARATRGVGMAA